MSKKECLSVDNRRGKIMIKRWIRWTIIWVVSMGYSIAAYAADLDQGHRYRLGLTLPQLKAVGATTTDYVALKNNKFIVLNVSDDLGYIVQFTKIYISSDEQYKDAKWVVSDVAYVLPKDVVAPLAVTSIVSESLAGVFAGPLIVPLKYRLGDKSLTGEAMLGFYTGMTFETGCTRTGWCLNFTPLFSAGISQVFVSDEMGSGENKSAVTMATGFLITGWPDINVGLVYGQDRTGDLSWKHEGDGWIGFMVGWQL